jgi:hypothetical protein
MHARRFACFILGLWLGGSLFMAWVATQNFREVDRLLSQASPEARLQLKTLGPNARTLLRYQASEQNRWYFEMWETCQLILGSLFFLLMLFGSGESKYLLGGILLVILLVCLQRFFLTPEIVARGRVLDFVRPDRDIPERNQFWVLHTGYVGIEVVKWALLTLLAARMVFSRKRSGRSRDSRRDFNMVDKANYGRIDG